MKRLKAITIASCLFLLAVAFLPSSKADEWNKKTIITINEPLAIPGKVLQPGTYVMKLLDSPAERHIVQIFNKDESQIEATIIAMPNYRLTPADKTQFAFWEMPSGQPRALKAWFYPGDNFGQEFAYPKEVASTIAKTNNENVPTVAPENNNQIAGMTTPSGETQAAEAAPAPQQAEAQPAPAPAPAPAQPSTAEAQPAPASAPQPAPAPQPANTSLPRTASPFPLVGLAGLLSAGAALATRRVRRHA
jgi:hypothetical protein